MGELPEVWICQVCRHALDLKTTVDGGSWIHSAQDPDDHEPVPVVPDPAWRGRCDFCSTPGAGFVLPARDFRVPGNAPAASRGNWAACAACAASIQADDWEAVIRRATDRFREMHPQASPWKYSATIRTLYRALRRNTTGTLYALD